MGLLKHENTQSRGEGVGPSKVSRKKELIWEKVGLNDFTFIFHFPALEKEMATHSSVLTLRIPGTGESDGLPSMGSHRVGPD